MNKNASKYFDKIICWSFFFTPCLHSIFSRNLSLILVHSLRFHPKYLKCVKSLVFYLWFIPSWNFSSCKSWLLYDKIHLILVTTFLWFCFLALFVPFFSTAWTRIWPRLLRVYWTILIWTCNFKGIQEFVSFLNYGPV